MSWEKILLVCRLGVKQFKKKTTTFAKLLLEPSLNMARNQYLHECDPRPDGHGPHSWMPVLCINGSSSVQVWNCDIPSLSPKAQTNIAENHLGNQQTLKKNWNILETFSWNIIEETFGVLSVHMRRWLGHGWLACWVIRNALLRESDSTSNDQSLPWAASSSVR